MIWTSENDDVLSLVQRQLQNSAAELSGQRINHEQMFRVDLLTSGQAQMRNTPILQQFDIRCVEEMPLDNGGNSYGVGRGAVANEGAAKKSSSALATTASTCQVPGGTSLLVGCVLGKSSVKPTQQVRGPLKRKLTDKKKELVTASPNDTGLAPNEKGGAGVLPVPRSMSINCPHISSPNSAPIGDKLSGNTMTHLFDKVASVTDCRSTGHFVLPKRKVEEHFPPLSKPGGVWMKLIDASGKEWSFEFCFWHSKDSRIYYFKKFYPYVQSTDLRGGDTVYFSRLEPEGTLFMGYRKQKPAASKHKGAVPGASKDVMKESLSSSGEPREHAEEGKSALDEVAPRRDIRPVTTPVDFAAPGVGSERAFNKRKRRMESSHTLLPHRTKVIDHLAMGEALIEKKSGTRQPSMPQAFQHVDRIAGFLGSKGKRLRVNMEEYCEWEETQDLLRPPPGAVPTIVNIEGHEFEEYKEPPVLIKRTYFSPELLGEENQWVKCDDCASWRKLPADAFVPARWICSDNTRDPRRAQCSAPQELTDHEIDQLLGFPSDTDGGMESEEDSFDEETVNCESSPSSHEDKCYYTGPLLSSTTSALVDGSSQQNVARHDLIDKCKSYSSERKPCKKMAGSMSQSAGLRQDCLLSEPSAVLSVRRSSYIPSGAGKGHQLCTGCDECIGSAAQACKQCGRLTEYGARRRAQFIEKLHV